MAALLATTALPTASGTDSLVNVGNVAPLVVSVTLPGSSVSPTAGSTTAVATTIVVSDANGYNDISSVAVLVLKPDGSTTHVASAAATFDTGSALTATYTYSFNMNFYDDPALTTSTYKVKVTVTDSQGASGTNLASLAVFNYAELAALTLGAASLDMGSSLDPGDTSSAVSLGVTNAGNVQIDAQVSGTDLAHDTESASIDVGNMAYSTASDMSGSAALGSGATTLSSFNLAKGASSSKDLYWQLTVPDGADQWVPSGDYTGTLTVAAVSG
ncbi:MAG TPA: hypothetical protein VGR28_00845 [Candidatus Thermoplasmatota archaeon]|nr:hypothetical protein [Candidatus Thermoplasmatota archaeon]